MKYTKQEAIELIGGTEEDYQDFRGTKEQVSAKLAKMFSIVDETLAEEIAIYANEGFDKMARENGSIQHEGQELALTQIAYADNMGTDGDIYYKAAAIDRAGNDYEINWDLKEEVKNRDVEKYGYLEDESEACDWDSPSDVRKLDL